MNKRLPLMTCILLMATQASADTLSQQLRKGPLIQVTQDKRGVFKKSTVLVDVAAPIDRVWDTLADFERYSDFMPRCEEVGVKRRGNIVLVDFDIDTPLVSTSYVSRYTLNKKKRRVDVKVIDGDIEDSVFTWQLAPSPAGTRITYSGVVRNFSSIVDTLDDDQRTIAIAINVVSILQGAKALKREAEKRHRAMLKRVKAAPSVAPPRATEVGPPARAP